MHARARPIEEVIPNAAVLQAEWGISRAVVRRSSCALGTYGVGHLWRIPAACV